MIHVASETIKLSRPLKLSCFTLSILSQVLLQLLELFFHILPEILKILRHCEMKNILKSNLYLLFNLLKLLLIFQSTQTKFILLFFIITLTILFRIKPIFPAQSSPLLLLFLLTIFPVQFYLFFLQERKYVCGWFDSKVKIFECISLDILVRKQLEYFFINLCIVCPYTLLLLLLLLEI